MKFGKYISLTNPVKASKRGMEKRVASDINMSKPNREKTKGAAVGGDGGPWSCLSNGTPVREARPTW